MLLYRVCGQWDLGRIWLIKMLLYIIDVSSVPMKPRSHNQNVIKMRNSEKLSLSWIIFCWGSFSCRFVFYWPFQGGTSFVDLLCFCSVLCLLCFVHVCLYVLCGHLLGKGWPLGSRLWCLLWVCHFPIGILGQVWYLIVSIPDLCTITYF